MSVTSTRDMYVSIGIKSKYKNVTSYNLHAIKHNMLYRAHLNISHTHYAHYENNTLNCSLIRLIARCSIILWTGKCFEVLDRDYYSYQVDHPTL